jgi:hypothetical protein
MQAKLHQRSPESIHGVNPCSIYSLGRSTATVDNSLVLVPPSALFSNLPPISFPSPAEKASSGLGCAAAAMIRFLQSRASLLQRPDQARAV